jgi:hypothetical protein
MQKQRVRSSNLPFFNYLLGQLSARYPSRMKKQKSRPRAANSLFLGGSGEIRTHERLTPSAVFKTAAFNHSATLPDPSHYTESALSRTAHWSFSNYFDMGAKTLSGTRRRP